MKESKHGWEPIRGGGLISSSYHSEENHLQFIVSKNRATKKFYLQMTYFSIKPYGPQKSNILTQPVYDTAQLCAEANEKFINDVLKKHKAKKGRGW